MFLLENKNLPVIFLLFAILSCTKKKEELIVFHAGSLSSFMESLKKELSDVKILNEASGSVEVVRKAISLNKPCDLLLLSDARLIDSIPSHYIHSAYVFAYNCMVLVYQSDRFPQLTSENWITTFSSQHARIGRSHPCLDPSGYRALIILNELSKHFPALQNLIKKSKNFIRPKETDLIVYFNMKELDAMITYKSIALENNFQFIELPDSLNFGVDTLDSWYRHLCVHVGECQKTFCGSTIAYAIVVLNNTPGLKESEKVLHFLQSQRGKELLSHHGFRPTWVKIR